MEISDIRVLHATHTRRSFLSRVFQPVLKPKGGQNYTLVEALGAVSGAAEKLNRFGTLYDGGLAGGGAWLTRGQMSSKHHCLST